MKTNIERLLLLAFLLIFGGCSLVPNLSGRGNARAVLMPQYIAGQYGTQTVINPNLSADINHLTVELRYAPSLTLVANRDIPKGELTNPIVFNNLRANTTYRVVAIAYKTSDTSQVLSTSDANSYTEFTTTSDDAPAIAPLKVKLTDVAFNGVGTSSFSVTPGSYVTGTSKMSITCKGNVFTLAGVAPYADGIGLRANFYSPVGMAIGNGAIYISDYLSIRKLDLATNAVTAIAGNKSGSGFADGTGTAAKFASAFGLALDNNYLYVADFDNNRIRRVDLATNAVTTIAGQSTAGTADGTGTAAQFWRPNGLVVDNGFLYVSDFSNNRIRRLTLATNEVTTIAGSSGGTADGTGTSAQFFNPAGLAVANGYLYVADKGNNRIRRVDLATNAVTTLAGQSTTGTADGTGTAAKFYGPSYLVVDNSYLYVSDESNHRIRKLELATNAVTTIAGSSAGTADGTGTAAQFYNPNGLVMNNGSLYVADYHTALIRKLSLATNAISTIAGGAVSAGYTDGAGASVRMKKPQGLALGNGYLYFSDGNNNCIRRIDLATTEVTTIAGQTSAGFADGTGTAAKFNNPYGLALNNGYLYVADMSNRRIRRIDLTSNEVTTLAGQSSSGTSDGIGTAAMFNYPRGLAIDNGILYIADYFNQRIRRLDLATNAVTTIGTISGGDAYCLAVKDGVLYSPYAYSNNKMWKYDIAAGTSGVVSFAQFFNSYGIVADDDGYLYITGSQGVWKYNPITNTLVSFVGGSSGNADGIGTAAQFSVPDGIVMDKDNGILYVADNNNNCIRIIY